MKKFIAIAIAIFALNVFASDTSAPTKPHQIKVKRTTLKRIVKYQIQHFATDDDEVVLVDTVPTLGRNRLYYTWNRLVPYQLSDEIKLRLALARMKALKAYNQKWA